MSGGPIDDKAVAAFLKLFASSPLSFTQRKSTGPPDPATGKRPAVYVTVKGAMRAGEVRAHLRGEICLVAKPVLPNGTCAYGVIDIDVYTPDPCATFEAAKNNATLPLHCFHSKSGGMHAYTFFSPPSHASVVRRVLADWAARLGHPNAEIFPKQDQLSAESLGNGIALPFFGDAQGFAQFRPEYYAPPNGDRAIPEPTPAPAPRATTEKPIGIPLPPGMGVTEFARLLGTKLNYRTHTRNGTTYFDYHGLAGLQGGAKQPCLIQGSVHKAYRGQPSEAAFAVQDGRFYHTCFDTDCRGAVDEDEPSKTRRAVRALGLDGVLLVQTEGTFDLVRLGDLLREPPETIEWCVEEMLPAGGLSLWPAKPKVGKSTLLRWLALCVANGRPFIGRNVVQGTVVYLALEEKRSQVRQHFAAMGATGEEEIYIHAAHAPKAALLALRKLVDERKPFLIVIDPLQKFMRAKDTNDYAEVTLALEPFLILARETGAHVAVAHHAGKIERADATDAILGSTALFGGADVAVVLRKYEKYRTVTTIGRYGVDMDETVLTLDPATRIPTPAGTRQQFEEDRIARNLLEEATEPKERTTILKEAEGKYSTKIIVFKKLVRTKELVVTSGTGKKGDPKLYAKPDPSCTLFTGTTTPDEATTPEVQEEGVPQFPVFSVKGGNGQRTGTKPLKNEGEMLVPGVENLKTEGTELPSRGNYHLDPQPTPKKPKGDE